MKAVLYNKELKSQRKSVLLWTLVVCIVTIVSLSLFPMVKEMYKMLADFLNSIPELAGSLGEMGMSSINNVVDFFVGNFSMNLVLVGSIFAAITASSIMRKEYMDGSAEFLYSMPIKHTKIFSTKFLALFTSIMCYELILLAVTIISCLIIGGGSVNILPIIVSFASMILLHLIVGIVVLGLASVLKKSFGIGVSIALVFGLYFITMISSISEEVSFLQYFSPFSILQEVCKTFADINWWVVLIWSVVAIGITIYSMDRIKNTDVM